MPRSLLTAVGCCVAALACLADSATPASAADAREVFEKLEYKDSAGNRLLYRMMKPVDYDASRKYPLVIFLHGAGERGDDNTAQLVHGMNDFARDENRKAYPCFVIAPQCPKGKRWVEVDWSSASHTQPEKPSDPLGATLELVETLQKEFSIDSRRLYITGLSMGGYGTWDAIQRRPETFAAAVPVCGGGDEKAAGRLVKIPIWCFHGALDQAVKPERSRNMIAAIRKAGGNPRYTEYADVGHDSWVRAYSDPEMMKWLFSQELPAK
jgi:predicted peptidase